METEIYAQAAGWPQNSANIRSCQLCGGALPFSPATPHVCGGVPGPQIQERRPPVSYQDVLEAEIQGLRRQNTHLQTENAQYLRDAQILGGHIGRLRRLKAEMTDLAASLQIEIAELRAKYEPDPPPDVNPWGRMFRGGVGAAIER